MNNLNPDIIVTLWPLSVLLIGGLVSILLVFLTMAIRRLYLTIDNLDANLESHKASVQLSLANLANIQSALERDLRKELSGLDRRVNTTETICNIRHPEHNGGS